MDDYDLDQQEEISRLLERVEVLRLSKRGLDGAQHGDRQAPDGDRRPPRDVAQAV